MNVECDMKDYETNAPSLMPEKLIQWMKEFRAAMKKWKSESLVIWYDSVLHDGSLNW